MYYLSTELMQNKIFDSFSIVYKGLDEIVNYMSISFNQTEEKND